MGLTKRLRVLLAGLCAAAAHPAIADVTAELADLSGRIDYGFYAEEQRVIDAARAELARLPENDPAVRYYRAFAAFRTAQLRPAGDRTVASLLEECATLAPPPPGVKLGAAAEAEAWILLAACAAHGVHRGLSQQRRRDQALARARELDAAHPRIALLEAWSISARPALEPAAVREPAAAKLALAAELFRDRSARIGSPEWGEAEALAQLGEIHLQHAEARTARDVIERALLVAPDYRFALSLRARVQGAP